MLLQGGRPWILSIIYSTVSIRKKPWVMKGSQYSLWHHLFVKEHYVFVPISLLLFVSLPVQVSSSLKVLLFLMATKEGQNHFGGKFCLAILLTSLYNTLVSLKKRRPEIPKPLIDGSCLRECL